MIEMVRFFKDFESYRMVRVQKIDTFWFANFF